MDLQTVIIGLLSIAVFLVPILYIQRRQKGKAGAEQADFLSLGEQQQLRLTQYEFWNGRYAIGLDEGQRKLLYLNRQVSGTREVVIDLADIQRCEVLNVNRAVNDNLVIDEIDLRFSFIGDSRQELRLEFYNKEQSMMLSGELQLARKWERLVNASIAAVHPSA